jgi:guanylate kinase
MSILPAPDPRPFLLVLSGPSGVGKSSVIDAFRAAHPDFVESISATTRAPRGQERDGVDYHFVSAERFAEMVARKELLEHACVFGTHSYGTPRAYVEEQFAAGRCLIMDIDVQGARQIKASLGQQACLVFIAPPSLEILEQRLRGRGTDDPAAVAKRLDTAHKELAAWRSYDFVVVNDQLERAVADLAAIVRARRLAVR